MRSEFNFAGESSLDYGLYIDSVDTFGGPERQVTEFQIPGLLPKIYAQDEGTFTPYIRQYNCALMSSRDDLPSAMARLKYWLMRDNGFWELSDTYSPQFYRKARFTGAITTEWLGAGRRNITFPLTFSCQPQLFYKDGADWIDIKRDDSITLYNPSNNFAFPEIEFTFDDDMPDVPCGVYFGGPGGVGTIELEHPRSMTIDTETHECGYQGEYNGIVTFTDSPWLYPADYTGVSTLINGERGWSPYMHVRVKPNWWTW